MSASTVVQHTPAPWELNGGIRGYKFAVIKVTHYEGIRAGSHIAVADIPETNRESEAECNARLVAAAPNLLADARKNDEAFTWLAEQMNSITDNATHWSAAQLQTVAQDLRVVIESHQQRTRLTVAEAEGRS